MAKLGKSKLDNLSVNFAITSVECSKSAEWDVHIISEEFFQALQNSFGQDVLRRILKKLDIEGEIAITKTYVLVNRWTIYVDTVLIKCKLPDVPFEQIHVIFKDQASCTNTGKANTQINRS